ncbi:MAG: hypothetical protein QME57_00855 [Patescibacteria group bacterium]|nr:hypothetical protein [Patescibacteria group bacterium]
MAITFIEERRKLGYLFLALVIVILITIVVLWQGFFAKEKLPPLLPIETPLKKIMINLEILKHPLLEKLKPFEAIPSFEEEVGRENPFIPYSL